MANPLPIALLDEVVDAPGSGEVIDVGPLRQAARLRIDVQQIVGPVGSSVTLYVETRAGSGDWTLLAQARRHGTGPIDLTVGILHRFVRARWTLDGGATSATVTVSGEAHVIYCTPEDVTRFSMPERGLEGMDHVERLDACLAATDEADGYVGGAYTLPLVAWDEGLRKATARISGADLLSKRGADPEGPDSVVFQREEKAHEWLNRLANGRLKPPGIVDQTPETFEGGSVVVSRPRRGW